MPKDVLEKETKTVFFEKISDSAIIPKYAKLGDAGLDLYSDEDVVLNKGESKTISTGVRIKLPENTVGFVTPRSGMASKFAVTVGNAPGTCDSQYTGELKIILINHGQNYYEIKKGDRIAQLVVCPVLFCQTRETDFSKFSTERGDSGFGSSGK